MRFLLRRRILILSYHGFTDRTSHRGIENNHGKHLNIGVFISHLEYLTKHYRVIALDRLVEYYRGGAPVPPNSVVVTIDDGYESTYTLAYPALRRFQAPATVFVTTDFVDRKDYLWTDRLEHALTVTGARALDLTIGVSRLSYGLQDRAAKLQCDSDLRSRLKRIPQDTRPAAIAQVERGLELPAPAAENLPPIYRPLEWSQVLEMLRSGIVSIGSHTVSHVIVTRCGPERALHELQRSKQIIEERTGVPCVSFCYPNGQVGCFDGHTKQLLKELGYACGITTVFGTNGPDADPYELRRLYFDDRGEITRFIMTLCGIVGMLNTLKRLVRRSARTRPIGAHDDER